MILIIGGLGSGKRSYARQMLGYSAEQMTNNLQSDAPVLYDLQAIVSERKGNTKGLYERLIQKEVVICNEVGCGVVPMDRDERAAREETGRLLIRLANASDQVIRMYCGIGQKIKG